MVGYDEMTEKEILERTRRRKEMKRRRIRRVKMIRAAVLTAILAVCVGTGILVSQMGKKSLTEGPPLPEDSESIGAVAAVNSDAVLTAERETAPIVLKQEEIPEISAIYGIYVHGKDWSHYFADDSYCMAPAGSYVTAMRATLQHQPEGMTGTIEYKVNLSGSGWQDWTEDNGESGGTAGEMPIEAVSARLTGELAEYYDILYSVLQDGAWTDWVKNGEEAGVSGAGLRADGLRMSVVKKLESGVSYAGNIDPSKPMVALSYDDGPSAANTPRILAALKASGARATFFMVGKQAEKNTDLIRQMADQGCEVANHTYDHKLMSKVDPAELTSQLERTNQVVADACGVSPVLMRPCGGVKNDAGMFAVAEISMPAVLWSIDTLDWKTRDAQNTIKTVLDQVQDGDIILMHDLYDATALASETIIPELVKRGYQLVTVTELSSYRGGMLPGRTYSKFRPK